MIMWIACKPVIAKVENEIELGVPQSAGRKLGEDIAFRSPVEAGNDVLDEFLVVLVRFHAEEHGAQDHRQDQEQDEGPAIPGLRCAHGKGHRQAAAQKHDRVERAQTDVEDVAATFKSSEVEPAINA